MDWTLALIFLGTWVIGTAIGIAAGVLEERMRNRHYRRTK